MFGKKKQEPTVLRCMFCNRELTAEEKITNEVKYEHAEGESSLGFICNSCADTLDQIQEAEQDNAWQEMYNTLDDSSPWWEPIPGEEDEDEL